ncbi:MAG: FkbM family methyltransferase [Clostridia bacterium]|nr:FkbM family methyltransferase [Clostridia bacterium]
MINLSIENNDLWTYLQSSDKPIVMYGMGNGADKILAVCEKYGIEVCDFFASDGFVRGHAFHGKTVLSYSEIKEKYKDFIVLVSFATSLPDVLDRIYAISQEAELYVPDVPVFGETLFAREFVEENAEKIRRCASLFADDESVRVYENVINAKLTGKISYLRASETDRQTVYREILRPQFYRAYADLGAYNGDTVRELLQYAPNLEFAAALEPDGRNFRKLSEYAQSESRLTLELHNVGAWDHADTLFFDGSGNRNANISSAGKKTKEVKVDALDNILRGRSVDYIKYDVEGSERQALEGSKETITRFSPDLLVSMYHRSEDVFELPLMIHEMNPEYRLYLRRFSYLPAWDLNLYAIK